MTLGSDWVSIVTAMVEAKAKAKATMLRHA
jgi:hypothetical protein